MPYHLCRPNCSTTHTSCTSQARSPMHTGPQAGPKTGLAGLVQSSASLQIHQAQKVGRSLSFRAPPVNCFCSHSAQPSSKRSARMIRASNTIHLASVEVEGPVIAHHWLMSVGVKPQSSSYRFRTSDLTDPNPRTHPPQPRSLPTRNREHSRRPLRGTCRAPRSLTNQRGEYKLFSR
jgi:hypothetical protein